MRILLLEDETTLRENLTDRLRSEGFVVDAVGDGVEGAYFAVEYPLDLAIVDLGLPGKSGLDVVKELRRAEKRYPVLILTARDHWQDKVEALDSGADDYLTKPFRTEELIARVHALLRRAGGHATSELRFGPLAINLSSRKVSLGDQPLDLTRFEYKLLEYFVLHPDQVLSKMQLNEHLYEDDADPESNVIEVILGRLRKKLDPDGDWKPIQTLRGQGYRFSPGGA
ncbi:MAG: DNA-binding response regulator [Xanthomonadales bacterium]|nr:DNA-binding response regulator [Xanthomonadales bacterium]|tara:strand:- start:343 stop:1020 length:678 start_codon:yes stop_codon:yes gene_type:complete